MIPTWNKRHQDGGDRCVVIVVTKTPDAWAPALKAWAGSCLEIVVTNNALQMAPVLQRAIVDIDLLVLCVDDSGLAELTEYPPDGWTIKEDCYRAPCFPVAHVCPGHGTADEWGEHSRIVRAWERLRYPWDVVSHVSPHPFEVTAWAVGWWAREEHEIRWRMREIYRDACSSESEPVG